MNREEAFEFLREGSNYQRFLAAKSLVRTGVASDLSALMAFQKREVDAYAKRWIGLAIAACANRAKEEAVDLLNASEDALPSDERDFIRTQAVEWVASALLHEIGSKIGLLVSAAKKEFVNYSGSDTERHLTNIRGIFHAIAELRKAAAVPEVSQLDLAQLIEDVVTFEASDTGLDVSLVGRKQLLINSDPALLRLALCNGIRNAIEAMKSLPEPGEHKLLVTWELTDKEFWISVIDDGPGVEGATESIFDIGRTNKLGHAGFGLAIAKQAMDRLGGTVQLTSSAAGGAVYELRGGLHL